MADPLVGLPTSGSYPLHLGGSLRSDSKKRRRDDEEHVAIRYAFKPVSVDASTPGSLQHTDRGRQAVLRPKKGPQQVFDVREEESKARECVLIYDPTVQTFTLHAVPTALHFTLNRSLSGKDQPLASRRRSESSSNSSSSVPLARQHPIGGDADSQSSNEKHEVSSIVGPSPAAPKRARPSETGRVTTGGKSTPRKTVPLAKTDPSPTPKPKAQAKSKAAPKAKAKETKKGGGRGKAHPPPVQISGKVKSAEFIEDSDEEYGVDEEEDEFAKLVGESLAQDDNAAPQDDSDDDDDEDEDEDDELGGARLVGGDW